MKATQCLVEGCDRNGKMRRGMCHMHYSRLKARGTTDPPLILTIADRLAAGLVLRSNGCLEWTRGCKTTGYGMLNVDRKSTRTHRLAWILKNGPIPDGLCVLHHCDNPPCCQTEPTEGFPEGHLFLGTKADNSADMAKKGRGRQRENRTHCPHGHPYDTGNTLVNSHGSRCCRICGAAATARARAKKKRKSL